MVKVSSSKKSFLFLIVGEPYLRRIKADRLIKELLPDENRSFGLIRLDLKETSIEEIITQARSFPMLGEKQVFLIQNAEDLKKERAVQFEAYFEHPAEWSYFILEANALDETHAVSKLALRLGERIECLQNDKRDNIGLIHAKLKAANRSITKEAWQFMEEKTGNNLTLLDSCVEKLILYVEEGKTIDLESAQKLIDQLVVYDTFDLTEAVSEKNPKKALKVFEYLYELEGDGIMVIGLLNWQLKRLWQAKLILDEKGEREMARVVRVSPYRLPAFVRQVNRFQIDELKSALQKLFQLDWRIKTGACLAKPALETFLIELSTAKKQQLTPGKV